MHSWMCEYISAFTLLCFAVLVQLLHQGVKRKQEVAAVPGRWGWNTPDSDNTGKSVQLFVTCVCVCGSGGWYCFDSQTCESRYETMRRLMSSTKWPLTRTGTVPTACACRIHFYHTHCCLYLAAHLLTAHNFFCFSKSTQIDTWHHHEVCLEADCSKTPLNTKKACYHEPEQL